MHPMNTLTHRDCSMKIERLISNDTSSSRATWRNLDASTYIEWMWLKDDDSQIDIQSEPLIKDETMHRTVVPKFAYRIEMFFDGRHVLGFLSKSICLDTIIWELFDF